MSQEEIWEKKKKKKKKKERKKNIEGVINKKSGLTSKKIFKEANVLNVNREKRHRI